MNSTVKKRIAAGFTDLVLLAAGPVTAALMAAYCPSLGESYSDGVNVLCIIALCFFVTILVVEIISVFKISDSTAHTVYIAAFALGFCLFSTDFANVLADRGVTVSGEVFDLLNFGFFVLLSLSIIYFWNYTYNLHITTLYGVLSVMGAVACVAVYVGLCLVNLQIIALVVYCAELCVLLFFTYKKIYDSGSDNVSFYLTEAFLFAVCGSGLTDTLCGAGIIDVVPLGFSSYYSVALIVIFALTYVSFAMRTDKAANKASEYKQKYESVKSEALRGQIKPHFIFNSLAAIQSLYHRSLEEGDRATTLFSRHLRANVEAENTDLIPFEKELDNIQVYVELENMRYDQKFNVIFDIDEQNFEVPVLSLQPYIENAMRYSRVNEKPDGYIKITSRRMGDFILLEVSDNGVGFVPDEIPPSSCGIRNSRERFEVLMGVEPVIESIIGGGTIVTINIPVKEKQGYENNNR